MATVKLLRQLDGKSEGETAEYPILDAKRLAEMGIVVIIDEKDAAPPESSAETAAPENKAEVAPANKSTPRKKAS